MAESSKFDRHKCKPKSMFLPPSINASVETFIKLCQMDMDKINWKKKGKPNLSRHEYATLMGLRKDVTISIRPADKGGALVVMNTSEYVAEMNRQLTNGSHYRILGYDPTGTVEELLCFKERLDNQLDTISFTIEYDMHLMHFLDVSME
ncbi:Hypothetical predicted protein, partial [Pelobates cultripes]